MEHRRNGVPFTCGSYGLPLKNLGLANAGTFRHRDRCQNAGDRCGSAVRRGRMKFLVMAVPVYAPGAFVTDVVKFWLVTRWRINLNSCSPQRQGKCCSEGGLCTSDTARLRQTSATANCTYVVVRTTKDLNGLYFG